MATASSKAQQAWEFYTKKKAAQYLSATERQISRWSQQGRLAHVRLGNRTLFTREQLDAFVAANTREAVR
jgi:excisionase family DNA binding protein